MQSADQPLRPTESQPSQPEAPADPAALSGLVVGGVRLHSVLGRGGMGTVYRATQVALGREVAVKLVPSGGVDEALVARFRREAQRAAALDHPNIVPIYAAGEEEGLLYLVMRLIEGPDLSTLVAREGPLAPRRAAGLVEQVAVALDAVHAAGLVHRDVKPANVLVERHGDHEHAFLSDFGLMRRVVEEAAITRQGEFVGTIDYMAPEQVQGRAVDARADVYALAAVLYMALSGGPPFPAETATAAAYAHVHAPAPRVDRAASTHRRASKRLNDVIARGMAKSPEDRYATAGELARAAQTAVSAPTRRRRSRTAAAAVLVTLAFGGVAVGLALSLQSSSTPRQPRVVRVVRNSGSQFTGPFRFSYPAGWRLVEDESPQHGFFRTAVISPDRSEMVIVDRTPGELLGVETWARSIERETAAQTPGYALLGFHPATIAGRKGVVWSFTQPGAYGARVDIFQRIGSTGYAVLGEAATTAASTPVALSVARSLRARS